MGNDFRSAARALLGAPAFTVSAVLCLALGMGVTAAIVSAVDRALLRPLPFRAPERLVTIYRTSPHANNWPFSAPNYSDLAAATRQVEAFAAVAGGASLVSLPDQAVRASTMRVTGNFFGLLGVKALHGRLLAPGDDQAGQNKVAVLSEEFWRTNFGGDANIVSRTVQLDGEATIILGVLPQGFRVPNGGGVIRADVWLPMRFTRGEREQRGSNFLRGLGRLAPGATPESAQRELVQLFDDVVKIHPDLSGESVRVVPLQSDSVGSVRMPLLLLLGAVLAVLLIASTNVASLLLARGIRRQREMAVRVALGASRWAVMRPVLAESLLIAALGAVVGLGLAWAGVRTIGVLAVRRMPQLLGLSVDLRVVMFALLLSLIVAIVCGALPAWRSTQVDPQDALRDGRGGGAGRGHQRALGVLVVVEVALSLVLLIGAGLVLKGFTGLMRSEPGFDPAPLFSFVATISPQSYTEGSAVPRFLEPALAGISRDPSVAGAGAISLLPYRDWGNNFTIRYEGQSGDDQAKRPVTEVRIISPDFFGVTGQRLLSGRPLRESDDGGAKAPVVVVVNEALVKRDFPARDPIGKRFYTGDTTFATIVGVVSDIKNVGPFAPPQPEVYQTYLQAGRSYTSFTIVVRTRSGGLEAAEKAAQAAVRSVDRGAAITRVMPMSDVISESVGRPRFLFALMGVFAAVAVALAVAGLYGVMSYVVAQRTRELGIRAALGSTPGRAIRLVAQRGLLLVAAGIGVGFAASTGVMGLMRSMLYGVSPLDPATYLLAAASVVVAGVAAVIVPSFRATRVDPISAIRME
jgi:putative ABC transport system permease protein